MDCCMLPTSIDLRVTARCQLRCDFCFGTKCRGQGLTINEWCALLDEFEKRGVRFLVITGGEPTLYSDIISLLKYGKQKKFNIILSSNGLSENLIDCCQYVDVLSLPMDGYDFDSCHSMRGLNNMQYRRVLNNMGLIKKAFPKIKIKIGTVVTKKNISKLDDIYHKICDVADIWKLYQVSPHENNKEIFSRDLEVADSYFTTVCDSLFKQYGKKTYIQFYRNSERSKKYLFCEPNGDAMVIEDCQETIIGNFVTSFESVLNKLSTYIDPVLVDRNVRNTYRL